MVCHRGEGEGEGCDNSILATSIFQAVQYLQLVDTDDDMELYDPASDAWRMTLTSRGRADELLSDECFV